MPDGESNMLRTQDMSELLIRMDERQQNIHKVVEATEEKVDGIQISVTEHNVKITAIEGQQVDQYKKLNALGHPKRAAAGIAAICATVTAVGLNVIEKLAEIFGK